MSRSKNNRDRSFKRGLKYKDSIYLTKKLEKIGFDYVCVSSGGILPKTNMKFKWDLE